MPNRYTFEFERQLKVGACSSGSVLDWPRHWRETRTGDLKGLIKSLDVDPDFSIYYENTLESINASEAAESGCVTNGERSVRENYEQFSYARGGNISGYGLAVGKEALNVDRSGSQDEVHPAEQP